MIPIRRSELKRARHINHLFNGNVGILTNRTTMFFHKGSMSAIKIKPNKSYLLKSCVYRLGQYNFTYFDNAGDTVNLQVPLYFNIMESNSIDPKSILANYNFSLFPTLDVNSVTSGVNFSEVNIGDVLQSGNNAPVSNAEAFVTLSAAMSQISPNKFQSLKLINSFPVNPLFANHSGTSGTLNLQSNFITSCLGTDTINGSDVFIQNATSEYLIFAHNLYWVRGVSISGYDVRIGATFSCMLIELD